MSYQHECAYVGKSNKEKIKSKKLFMDMWV